MILVPLEPERLFNEHPQAKAEFLSWAMSDSAFLASFVELLATGCSPEGSWPGDLDKIREAFHTAAGDEYLAEAMRKIQVAEAGAQELAGMNFNLDYRLKRAAELLPQVFTPGGEHALNHDKDSSQDWCPACQFIAAIKGTSPFNL